MGDNEAEGMAAFVLTLMTIYGFLFLKVPDKNHSYILNNCPFHPTLCAAPGWFSHQRGVSFWMKEKKNEDWADEKKTRQKK